MIISIEKAEYKGDYKIRLLFSDGEEQLIDFRDFLSQSSNPMTTKYLDKNEFSKFQVQYGDLVWNDYEMCFPIPHNAAQVMGST